MSKPKTYPPYRVHREGYDEWIVDTKGNEVLTLIGMGDPYLQFYEGRIMQIICDALNKQEPTP